MSKEYLIMEVKSSDYYDGAAHACVELTKDLLKRIFDTIQLAKSIAAKEPDFAYLELWDYSPSWGVLSEDDSSLLDDDEYTTISKLDGLSDEISVEACRLRIGILRGSKGDSNSIVGDFQWCAYDKHVGDIGKLVTPPIDEETLLEWMEPFSAATSDADFPGFKNKGVSGPIDI